MRAKINGFVNLHSLNSESFGGLSQRPVRLQRTVGCKLKAWEQSYDAHSIPEKRKNLAEEIPYRQDQHAILCLFVKILVLLELYFINIRNNFRNTFYSVYHVYFPFDF